MTYEIVDDGVWIEGITFYAGKAVIWKKHKSAKWGPQVSVSEEFTKRLLSVLLQRYPLDAISLASNQPQT